MRQTTQTVRISRSPSCYIVRWAAATCMTGGVEVRQRWGGTPVDPRTACWLAWPRWNRCCQAACGRRRCGGTPARIRGVPPTDEMPAAATPDVYCVPCAPVHQARWIWTDYRYFDAAIKVAMNHWFSPDWKITTWWLLFKVQNAVIHSELEATSTWCCFVSRRL